MLRHFGLEQAFDYIGGASMDASLDTKTAVMQLVLDQPQLAGKCPVMVGDRENDMAGRARLRHPCGGRAVRLWQPGRAGAVFACVLRAGCACAVCMAAGPSGVQRGGKGMNITVLGCGRWGSFLAWYHGQKHNVALWGRAGSRGFPQLCETRANGYVTLPDSVRTQPDLGRALAFSDTIVISISAQQLRTFARQLNEFPISGKTVILCMKGLECETGKRLTQVFQEEVHQPVALAPCGWGRAMCRILPQVSPTAWW